MNDRTIIAIAIAAVFISGIILLIGISNDFARLP